jgi:hypothetical protein
MDILLNSLLGGVHLIATALLVGYYLLLAVVFLPVIDDRSGGGSAMRLLGDIHKRWQPILILSVLAFIVTGSVMLLTNEAYQGLGDFFANPWSIWMTSKHVAVIAMIVLGFSVNAFFRGNADGTAQAQQPPAAFRRRVRITAATGVCVLLLTAVCQAL